MKRTNHLYTILTLIAAITWAAPSTTRATDGAQVEQAKAFPLETSDRSKFEEIIRTYLLAHPEIIPEAIDKLNERNRQKRIADLRSELETPFEGAWTGNPNGDVVIVEFFDYACGFCKRSAADLKRLVAEDPNVKIVYKEYPIISPLSAQAARTALQAARIRKYAEFHHDMFAAKVLDKKTLRTAANKVKVKLPRDVSALDTELARNRRLAKLVGVSGTPVFIIGGQFVSGAVGYDDLKKFVDDARSPTRHASARQNLSQ